MFLLENVFNLYVWFHYIRQCQYISLYFVVVVSFSFWAQLFKTNDIVS